MGVICAPEPLARHHDIHSFDCDNPVLNEWLRKRALKAQNPRGSARTYVVCSSEDRVVGYFSLAAGSINREDAPGKIKRNTPDPIPVIILGRLAVDSEFKSQGIGSGLLKDAFLRIVSAAQEFGVRAILVHALNENARTFYLKHGFYESPSNDFTLMVTIDEIQRLLKGSL